MTESESKTLVYPPIWSLAGLLIGFIALILAALSPWILDAISPPPRSIEEVAVDVAIEIKNRLVAKAKGEDPKQQHADGNESRIRRYYPPMTIGVGLLAACLAFVGIARHESKPLSAATVMVGFSAIAFQYFVLMSAAIVLILLVAVILYFLDIDLPSF